MTARRATDAALPTLVDLLDEAAERHGDEPRWNVTGTELSFEALRARSHADAAALRAAGVTPGARVALWLPNGPEFLRTYFGALGAGLLVNPLNPAYGAAELGNALRVVEPALVLTRAEDAPALRDRIDALGLAHPPAVACWQGDALRVDGPLGPVDPGPTAGDACALFFTSGTTGQPKAAMLSHRNFVASALGVTRAWGWTSADTLLVALPLFHMHGLGVALHGSLLTGARLVVQERFSPAGVLGGLAAHRATMLFGVPTMWSRLVQHVEESSARPPRLRLLVSGSAPLPPAVAAAVERHFGQVPLERYGMTETVMLAGNPLAGPRVPGTVGFPFEGVEIRVVDGEVRFRGPNVFAGYWRNPEATRAAFDNGWFRTGDFGSLDADGRLALAGRGSELILVGGYNVFPREVEDALGAAGLAGEFAVVGAPDADLGEVVAVATTGTIANARAAIHRLAGVLAPYKVPRHVVSVPAIPLNAMGKVDRRALAALLLAQAEG